MMLGYSAAQVRQAEKAHLDAGEPLMARAAAGLADEIGRVLEARGASVSVAGRGGVVVILAGSGDNGGDALYAGATLAEAGHDVRVLTTGERVHEDALAAAIAAGAHADARAATPGSREFEAVIEGVDVVVDGVLGTGTSAHPALRGRARDVVEAIRPALLRRIMGAPVAVAVEIPSGVGPDDGAVPDPMALPALVTVTFGAVKAGLLLAPASSIAGRVHLVDIGLFRDLEGVEPLVRLDA